MNTNENIIQEPKEEEKESLLNEDANILVLFGSPKKQGHTKRLLDAFFSACPETVNVQTVYLYDVNPKACIDCNACKKQEKCVYDDLDSIFQQIQDANLIIVATPVYNYSLPSPLKAFFDRLQPYYYAVFEREENLFASKDRKGILLVTSGRRGSDAFSIIKKQTKIAFDLLNTEFTGSYLAPYTDKSNISDFHLNNAAMYAEQLFS